MSNIPVPWGSGASAKQVQRAVEDYFRRNPPPAGQGVTDAQVATAVAAYLKTNPPAAGPPGATLLRQITVADQALLAISTGMVELRFACPGAVVGERYEAYIRSHRLNTATQTTPGRPAGYWIVSADCRAADTIDVAHMRPAIVIGGRYELFTDVVRINAG